MINRPVIDPTVAFTQTHGIIERRNDGLTAIAALANNGNGNERKTIAERQNTLRGFMDSSFLIPADHPETEEQLIRIPKIKCWT